MSRHCGGCTLCCRLLPTAEIDKPANTRCQHQRTGKGCAIYARRPISCRLWSCAWLIGDVPDELRRPDRSHYVIDPLPDFVEVVPDDGPRLRLPVVQIWCDPAHRNAHRDPALRRYLARRGEEGVAALIRYSSNEALTLIPPAMSETRDFMEIDRRTSVPHPQHSVAEIMQVLDEEANL